ncbi:carbon-nitrogen hydrolase family protein [Anthocerotibacter panamensis]|uniref:carbon-nitrogen hydrolase family protein n=1 Tax=Anthocerotibacter panamensis TaxID=2857077 RepID=UPI001C403951|nr:carbon-nitrogen hydrolase family protein [Anthocerotibacter panamensis]
MEAYIAAAIQMTSTPALQSNLAQAEQLIAEAVGRGATFIGLPENFAFMGPEVDKLAKLETISTYAETFLIETARRHRITLLGGGFPVPCGENRFYNTALLVGPTGEPLARYEKIHLFDVNLPDGYTYRESDTVVPGARVVLADAGPLGKIGVTVCYDLRFPELYRQLALQGAEVLVVPSAFTAYTGKDHWRPLLRTRAIENTCYVIAPAQVGEHYARRQTYGHAMIIDPWGNPLADAGDGEGMAIAPINPERMVQVRQQLPTLEHCRLVKNDESVCPDSKMNLNG